MRCTLICRCVIFGIYSVLNSKRVDGPFRLPTFCAAARRGRAPPARRSTPVGRICVHCVASGDQRAASPRRRATNHMHSRCSTCSRNNGSSSWQSRLWCTGGDACLAVRAPDVHLVQMRAPRRGCVVCDDEPLATEGGCPRVGPYPNFSSACCCWTSAVAVTFRSPIPRCSAPQSAPPGGCPSPLAPRSLWCLRWPPASVNGA